MAGRGNDQAQAASKAGVANSGQLQGNAENTYGFLAPELMSEAAHPAGYSPGDRAAMTTAAEQSAGGTQAGAVGQGALLAERTRNPGAAAAAIGASSRASGEQLSKNALGIQTGNAMLKENQRRAALSGLEGLYAPSVSGGNQALGEVANNVDANTNSENASWNWAKDVMAPTLAAAGAAAPQLHK